MSSSLSSRTANDAEEKKTTVSSNCSQNRSWIEELYICARDETDLPVPSSDVADVRASCVEDEDNLEQAAIDILQQRSACFSCHSSLRRRCSRLVKEINQANVRADVNLNVEKNIRTENSNEHIQLGSCNDEDKLRVFAAIDRGVYPDSTMRTVCEQLDSRLQKQIGSMEFAVNVYNVYEEPFRSTSICKEARPKTRKTFMRQLLLQTSLTVVDSRVKGQGAWIMTPETAKNLILTS